MSMPYLDFNLASSGFHRGPHMELIFTPSRARGFSLVEVMVVLVIVGIATAAVMVSAAPDPGRELRRDARELIQRFSVAQAEARRDGRIIYWQPQARTEGFTRRRWRDPDRNGWPVLEPGIAREPFPADSLLGERSWHSGHPVVQGELPLRFTAEPLGQTWEIELSSQGSRVAVRRDADGQFRVVP